MASFRSLFESTNLIMLSDDMKLYAEEAYQKTKEWLRLQKFEGFTDEVLYKTLQKEPENLFSRKVYHDEYENKHSLTFTISAKPVDTILMRFDGGFDSGNMNKIFLYFTNPKQITNFSDNSMKKDFIKRVYHELIHSIDPINNDSVIRKELDVDGKMIKQATTGTYQDYLRLPWEQKANLSTMAEIALEYLIQKNLTYSKIVKEIEDWVPKLSHPDYQKEKDYFEDAKAWKMYKEFMKKLLNVKLKGDKR